MIIQESFNNENINSQDENPIIQESSNDENINPQDENPIHSN
jgi:hypothetical protein